MGPVTKTSTKAIPGVTERLKYAANLARHQFESELTEDSPCLENLNVKADAGMPYILLHTNNVAPKMTDLTYLPVDYRTAKGPLKEPMPIIEHAIAVANKILRVLDEKGSFQDVVHSVLPFFAEFPELNTFVLKRKEEVKERDDFLKSCRPYGVQPLPIRFIGKYVMNVLESYLLNFTEDPECISAYRFSVHHGGGERIMDWFQYHISKWKNGSFYFFSLGYGDDQLWCFIFPDGSMVVLGPDVIAMDLNTLRTAGVRFMQYVPYSAPSLPQTFLNALMFTTILAYSHDVHVGGSMVVHKDDSLFSGVPGTTVRNIYSSAEIQSIVARRFLVNKPCKDMFGEWLKSVLDTVHVELGFTFKGFAKVKGDVNMLVKDLGSLAQYFERAQQVLEIGCSVPFLQHVVVPHEKTYLCVPADMSKFGAKLVLPGETPNQVKHGVFQMQRLVGLTFAGAWYHGEFYEFMRDYFLKLQALEKRAQFSCEGELCTPDVDDFFTIAEKTGWTPDQGLPTREWMIRFNTEPLEELLENTELSAPIAVQQLKAMKPLLTVADPFAEYLEQFGSLQMAENAPLVAAPSYTVAQLGKVNAVSGEERKLRQARRMLRDRYMSNLTDSQFVPKRLLDKYMSGKITKEELLLSFVLDEEDAKEQEIAQQAAIEMDQIERLERLYSDDFDFDDEDHPAEEIFNDEDEMDAYLEMRAAAGDAQAVWLLGRELDG